MCWAINHLGSEVPLCDLCSAQHPLGASTHTWVRFPSQVHSCQIWMYSQLNQTPHVEIAGKYRGENYRKLLVTPYCRNCWAMEDFDTDAEITSRHRGLPAALDLVHTSKHARLIACNGNRTSKTNPCLGWY